MKITAVENKFTVLGKDKPYQGLEKDLQKACINWTWYNYSKKHFWHTPNGGTRNKREAVELKKQGVKPGVSDIIFADMSRGFSGLVIELKAKKNKPTEDQIKFLNEMAKRGRKCVVAYSREAYEDAVNWYFNGAINAELGSE